MPLSDERVIQKPSDIHRALRECLAIFEAYRTCGFTSDMILATPDCQCPDTGRRVPGMILRTQGKTFVVTAPVPYPYDDFEEAWPAAAEFWNETSPEHRDEIWRSSVIYRSAGPFVVALANKGFVFPRPS